MNSTQASTSTAVIPANDNTVKKHVGAIHIKNDISCLQRKVWNVLLWNAQDEIGDTTILTHKIPVKDLMKHSGFDSKNLGYLKDALEDMVTTKLAWNIIDERGRNEWGVAAALADAVIVGGICSYSFSPQLRAKLYRPEVFGEIAIEQVKGFKSGHALALYENCVRYRGINQTPYLPVELLRDLIGVATNASYDDFKIFNRAVIKPAMQEINTISDISVEVELKREQRRVVALKFLVRENSQPSLPMDAPDVFDNALLARLQDHFCLTEKQAKDAVVQHSEDRLAAVMTYVEDRYKLNKIAKGKIAPYFLKVLKDGDLPASSESAFDREAKATVAKKTAAAKEAAAAEAESQAQLKSLMDEAKRRVTALSESERTAFGVAFERYVADNNRPVYQQWRDKGLASKVAATEYYRYFITTQMSPEAG